MSDKPRTDDTKPITDAEVDTFLREYVWAEPAERMARLARIRAIYERLKAGALGYFHE